MATTKTRQPRPARATSRRARLTPEQRAVRLLKALLVAKGVGLRDVAARVQLSHHLVGKVVLRQRGNETVRQEVARMLGLSYDHVWGSTADTHLYEALRRTLVDQHLAEAEAQLKKAAGE